MRERPVGLGHTVDLFTLTNSSPLPGGSVHQFTGNMIQTFKDDNPRFKELRFNTRIGDIRREGLLIQDQR